MSGRVEVKGLTELRRLLTNLPKDLHDDARPIVRAATESAAGEMAHRYPAKTGTLKRRVRTFYPAGGALVGIAQSTAPHSHLYEFGTRVRHTKKGAHRGVMPAATPAVVVPIATRWREWMFAQLVALLRGKGFQVDA